MRRLIFGSVGHYPFWMVWILSCLVSGAFVCGQGASTGSKKLSELGSLNRVPATAGSYFVTMNHKAVMDSIFESAAWKAIKSTAVSKGLKRANRRGKTRGYADYNEENPAVQYLQAYDSAFNNVAAKSAIEVINQIVEHEMFVFVDNNIVSVVDNARNAFSALSKDLNGQNFDELTDDEKQKLLKLVAEQFQGVKCPTTIMGARLSDPKGLQGLLGIVRVGAESLLENPQAATIREMWKVIETETRYLLTMQIDLGKLPLEEIDDLDEEIMAQIRPILEGKKFVAAMGIVDDMLLAGVANDTSAFTDFGQGTRLVDLPELNSLKEAVQSGKAITSAYYISKEMAQSSYSFADMFESVLPFMEQAIAEEMDIPADDLEILKQVPSWLQGIAKDIETFLPKPAMQYGYSYLTDEGIRGYQYQARFHPMLDGGRPLKPKRIAGKNTLLVMTQRMQKLDQLYSKLVSWMENAPLDLSGQGREVMMRWIERAEREKLADDGADNDVEAYLQEVVKSERVKLDSGLDAVLELMKSIDHTTRESLLPSIHGCESGLVVDVDSIRIETEEEFPILLPALAWESNDGNQIIVAMKQYMEAISKFVESANELGKSDEQWTELALPTTNETSNEQWNSIRWSLPVDWRVPTTVMPGVTAGPKNFAVSFTDKQAKHILNKRQANHLFGPALDAGPSASVFFFDNRVLMAFCQDWVLKMMEYGEQFDAPTDFTQFEAERDTLQFSRQQIEEHLGTIRDFIGCWQGYSSRMYIEGDGTSTQYFYKFQDVEPR